MITQSSAELVLFDVLEVHYRVNQMETTRGLGSGTEMLLERQLRTSQSLPARDNLLRIIRHVDGSMESLKSLGPSRGSTCVKATV